MKVLMAASHLLCPEIKNGDRNKDGFAHMVRYVADEIGRLTNLSVLTQSYFSSEDKVVGTFTFKKKTVWQLLCSFRLKYFRLFCKLAKGEGKGYFRQWRLLMYCLTGGFLEKLIRKEKPDVVFVHGIGNKEIPFIYACAETNTRIVITLHGLLSLDRNAVSASDFVAACEQNLLIETQKAGVPVTMIASGMKNRMEKTLNASLTNVTIVNNFCESVFEHAYKRSDRDDNKTRRILSIGSLYKLKNQIQIIRAYELLKRQTEENIELVIIGDGVDRTKLEEYVFQQKLSGVRFAGRLSHEDLIKECNQASVIVMASLCEGFGLPVLEGYWCGVPAVAFADLDAIPDLYSEDTMVTVEHRTDEALADGISLALNKKWDEARIIGYAERFSREEITKQYVNVLMQGAPLPSYALMRMIEQSIQGMNKK